MRYTSRHDVSTRVRLIGDSMKRMTALCMGMIVASLLCFDLQQEATAESSSKEQGVKRALLIGINKYQAVPKLQGSLNDIETMRQVLITRWGFSEGNIRLLTDEQATRDGMLAALNQFVHKTGPKIPSTFTTPGMVHKCKT